MIRKLIAVFLLTGGAHVFTLIIIKYLSKLDNSSIYLAKYGVFDSTILLITTAVGFGLQLATARELAITKKYKSILYNTQSARLMLSVFLGLIVFFGFFKQSFFIWILAPFFALVPDYALYGLGKPIKGAIVSFIRVVLPLIFLLLFIFFNFNENYLIFYLIIILVITLVLTGLLASFFLKTQYFVKPKIKNLILYLDNFKIGVSSFIYSFLGLGIINIIDFMYPDKIVAKIYILLKFFFIYKGVRMMFVQTFLREIKDEDSAIKVDSMLFLIAIVILNVLVNFPKSFTSIFLGNNIFFERKDLLLLGILILIISIFTSGSTKVLLAKKDNAYFRNLTISSLIAILLIITGKFFNISPIPLILLSIILGEGVLLLLNSLTLKNIINIIVRIKNILYTLLLATIPFILGFVMDDTMLNLGISLLSFMVFSSYKIYKLL